MDLSETFQVTIIIEKLPPAWKDFKSYLMYKRNKINLKDLIINKNMKRKMSFLWLKPIL